MSPHEAAQGVAWFAIAMFILIGLVIANDIRKEMKWATNRK